MTINLTVPNLSDLKPRIAVFGVGGAGGNAVNNMIESRLEGVEFVVAIAVLGAQDSITIHAGKRHHNLRPADLEHYAGERGRRGNKLPRGFQRVDGLLVE